MRWHTFWRPSVASDPIPLNAWRGRLQVGSKGERKTLYNLMLYLRHLPGLGPSVKFNQLTGNVEWRGQPLQDTDYVDMQIMVEQAGFQPSKADIPGAIARIAIDNAYHPIRDYLDGLQWDGVRRLDRFLPILFGTTDTAYERRVGPCWMIGAVARVYEPGCKMDNMLVLEGSQNLGKSSALRLLFGAAYFTELVSELRDHKKLAEQIAGKWVVEFAELAAIRGADIELVKAIITMQSDRYRPSYGRHTIEHPRQCVLAASMNPKQDQGYLKDVTGNRRFWPVRCTRIDMEKLARKRDLLWAEAVDRYRSGEPWWLRDDETALAEEQQSDRYASDPWEDHIAAKVNTAWKYTSVELLAEALAIPKERHGQIEKQRVAAVMQRLGWEQKVAKRGGRSVREWFYPSVSA